MSPPVPIVLFAYARPDHLARVLRCLREERVPLIVAFADGAKSAADAPAVEATRELLRAVDWCEVRLTERAQNHGLGRSVLAGVTEVTREFERFIVWEDDLICVPGTYAWICAALAAYAGEARVMSVTAWTHPRITPPDVGDRPYFDRRAECWVWGGYARSWSGMAQTALEKMAAARRTGTAPDAYGADLPRMARDEQRRNIWAVRWLYHHLQSEGLCLRPPWTMVEHIGFDPGATNAADPLGWHNPPLRPAPPLPSAWPSAVEHPACRGLWRAATADGRAGRLKRFVRKVLPARLVEAVRRRYFRVRWSGDYPSWQAAMDASGGYETRAIVAQVLRAARAVRDGRATYERDGVAFRGPPPPWPARTILLRTAAETGRGLVVLDFGGSLGSLYFQNRAALRDCAPLRWRVVEQPAFVEAGRREFQNRELEFYSTVEEACTAGVPDVLILASVLCYLPSPRAALDELLRTRPRQILVERTAFSRAGRTRLTVQHVPRNIYRASYPCWFFDRDELVSAFIGYRVAEESVDPIAAPDGLEFRSLRFERLPE